jgi:hypothetical protein
MRSFRYFLLVGAVALAWTAPAVPADSLSTVFTGVQDGVDLTAPPSPTTIVNTNTPFTLGTAPFTADFGGEAFAFHAGIPGLYAFSEGGRNFWGVRGDGMGAHTGVIAFSTPAASVTLLARGTPDDLDSAFLGPIGAADGRIRALDANGGVIAEVALQNDLPVGGIPTDDSNMQSIQFQGSVSAIELVNSGASNSFAEIALLSAQSAPEPSGLALLGFGLAGTAWYVWRQRRRTIHGSAAATKG